MNKDKMLETLGGFIGGMVQGSGTMKLNGNVKISIDVVGSKTKTTKKGLGLQREENEDKEDITLKGTFKVDFEDLVAEGQIQGGTKEVETKEEEREEVDYSDIEKIIKECLNNGDIKVIKALNLKGNKNQ